MTAPVVCVWCRRRPATERDHLTGRGPDGAYLDPDVWVPSCRRCNVTTHQLWRTLGIDTVTPDNLGGVWLGRFNLADVRLGDGIVARLVLVSLGRCLP